MSLFEPAVIPWPGARDLRRLHDPASPQHLVQFYDHDLSVIENAAYVAHSVLSVGRSCILIPTRAHLRLIEERLVKAGLDLRAAGGENRYLAVGAEDALAQIMRSDWPDEAKFERVVGSAVRQATNSSRDGFAFAFGEMVALLCQANQPSAALQLERLWNSLLSRYRFSLYCAYSLSCLGPEPNLDDIAGICAEHTLAVPAESTPKPI
jgi:hypothetical protein